jgi:hypothetical protein
MKACDLDTGAARIRLALKDLMHTWETSAEQWNDATSRAFAEHHLEPLLPVVKSALDAISRMDMLLGQAYRDCEK